MHLNPARAAPAGEDADLAPFDRRLEPAAPHPIAVALSGGADSLLALRLTLAWARQHGRGVIALIVDHGLQPQSAEWTAFAARTARALGAGARTLIWRGPHPATGLPAAARAARHRLLAEAARAAGARVIVTGHTASDAAENAVLGQGRLEEWSPSPAWPQGRGVFLLRPLLALSREAVRRRLAAEGAVWIDDPANTDRRHPRVRARQGLETTPASSLRNSTPSAPLAAGAAFEGGGISLSRVEFRAAGPAARAQFTRAALVCSGGGSVIPRSASISRLCEAIAGPDDVTATLCGARVIASPERILVVRNAGDITRKGLAPLALAQGEAAVWDGRYALKAEGAGQILALRGRSRLPPPDQRRALLAWPAAARPALPLILRQDGTATCPILASGSGDEAQWLVPARFLGACGLITREGQL